MSDAEDLRHFTRDLITRFERRTVAMERRLDAQTAQLREQTAALRDMRAEIRANTEGLLRVLDELRGSA